MYLMKALLLTIIQARNSSYSNSFNEAVVVTVHCLSVCPRLSSRGLSQHAIGVLPISTVTTISNMELVPTL